MLLNFQPPAPVLDKATLHGSYATVVQPSCLFCPLSLIPRPHVPQRAPPAPSLQSPFHSKEPEWFCSPCLPPVPPQAFVPLRAQSTPLISTRFMSPLAFVSPLDSHF